MNPEAFESYLMLHKYAIPPHGGLGLGLERFTSKLLEQNNVRYSSSSLEILRDWFLKLVPKLFQKWFLNSVP